MGSSPKPQQSPMTPGVLRGTVSDPAQTPRHPQYTMPFTPAVGIDEPQEPPQMMLESASPAVGFNPNSANPLGPADQKKQILQGLFGGGMGMRNR